MSNIIDSRYDIRLATVYDIPSIMEFIDKYWKKNHILSYDRRLFEYEFLEDSSVNMVLGIEKETGEIEGLYGFIKASKNMKDIWGSIWKVRDGNVPTLGIEIFRRMHALIGYRYHVDLGLNLDTSAVLFKKVFKWKVERMFHYYFLAPRDNYRIAKVDRFEKDYSDGLIEDESVSVFQITDPSGTLERFTPPNQIPFKDTYYLKKRYYHHPIYKYDVYGIEKNNRIYAIVVLRKEVYCERCAYRMVDYIGDHSMFKYCRRIIDDKLEEPGTEYVDFYCYGIDEKYILEAGFRRRGDGNELLIPNYFHPFEQRNIDIWIQIPDVPDKCTVVFCKADGDQDRPN